jgi:hypothetical protein
MPSVVMLIVIKQSVEAPILLPNFTLYWDLSAQNHILILILINFSIAPGVNPIKRFTSVIYKFS